MPKATIPIEYSEEDTPEKMAEVARRDTLSRQRVFAGEYDYLFPERTARITEVAAKVGKETTKVPIARLKA